MGRIVHVSGQINKHQSLADYSRIVQSSVLNLMQSLNGFAEDKSLTGKGYDSAKDYINSVHIPICQALYAALASEISANISVVSACGGLAGSDLIVEDELVTEKVYLAKEIERYEIAKQNVSFADTGLLQIYEEKIQSNKERIKEIDTELENLNTYDTKTQELHKNPLAELESVSNAISSISKGVSFGEGQFVVSKINMEWVNQYIENFSVAETEIKLNSIFPQTEIKFKALMHQQFGFDLLTSDIIFDLHKKIEKKYPNINQTERDYMFARVLSQFYYDPNEETGDWTEGAGSVKDYNSRDFCLELGMSEQDYENIKYMVRMQHFISSGNESYNEDNIKNMFAEGSQGVLIEKMKVAINPTEDISNVYVYLKYYEPLYENFSNTPDFAHFLYTISAGLASEEKLGNSYDSHSLVGTTLWSSSEERIDFTGWLGDATWPGVTGLFDTPNISPVNPQGINNDVKYGLIKGFLNDDVSFENDDYMSDLDADNIIHRLANPKNKTSLIETFNQYYTDNPNGDGRAKEFLENNSIDDIKNNIFERAGVKDMDGLKDTWKSSHRFVLSLEEISDELIKGDLN